MGGLCRHCCVPTHGVRVSQPVLVVLLPQSSRGTAPAQPRPAPARGEPTRTLQGSLSF